MKKIAVCYKWVLSEGDIRVDEKSRGLDFEKCKGQINEYDRVGLEVGVQLKAVSGAELVGVTCGVATEASTKDALARGADAVHYLDHPGMRDADSGVTAKVLAAALEHLGADVVICSEGSSDDYAQQVGPRLAAWLGFPSITYASKIEADGDTLKIERKLDEGIEVVELKAPAVISVIPDIGEAPIPGVKQILAAKKKPSHSLALADIGGTDAMLVPQLQAEAARAPQTARKAVRLNPEGTSLNDAVAALAKQLTADGIL